VPRPFRFTCPAPGANVLLRPRLLRLLSGRWDRRVVSVVAPAGFGKTTLLAQAAEENALAPRGVDVWLTCEPSDAGGSSLEVDLLVALEERAGPASVDRVAAAVWRRAPEHVALLLDDVHEIGDGSAGAAVLAGLVDELPANGHLVLAGRTDPAVPLQRLAARGQLVRLDEALLRLESDEVEALAARRGWDASLAEGAAGWPALVELSFAAAEAGSAGSGHRWSERYLWEEVLSAFDPERRRAIAAVLAVGGSDDEVASAAADRPVRLSELLDGMPFVDRRAGGTCLIHPLWAGLLGGELEPAERRAALRRAAGVHHQRGEAAEAVELLARGEDWSALRSVVVDACASAGLDTGPAVLERWRTLLPRDERGPVGDLLDGILMRGRDPGSERARDRLIQAESAFRAQHEDVGEVACLAHLTMMAWHRQHTDELRGLVRRASELAGAGCDPARRLTLLGRVLLASASQDHQGALDAIEEVDRGALPVEWAVALDALASIMLLMLGRTEEALAPADRAATAPAAAGVSAAKVDALVVRWFSARPLEVLARLPVPPDDTPTAYDRYVADALAATAHAWTGRCGEARAALESLARNVGTLGGTMPRAVEACIAAALAVAEHDEQAAAEKLRAFLTGVPLVSGPVEQALRRFLTLPYVLLAETRPFFDAQPYGPAWREQRAVARALVDAREGRPLAAPAVTPERVVAALPLPWAVEAGEALALAGHDLGAEVLLWLLEHLGGPARDAVRAASDEGGPARTVLASVPVPPAIALRLDVLGSAELRRGGNPVDVPGWRREKVRLLLLYLLVHRGATREEIAAALWPDHDGVRAGHNLRVNLNHLHRVLEPHRGDGDAPWFIRSRGAVLELHGGRHLAVDVWEVDRLLDEADRADRDGAPSVALAGVRRAMSLWRGDPLADARYEEWAALERERLRRRLVRAAVRAGELVLGAGDPDEAESHAQRALRAEPWSEGAYRVLIGACLDRGDRAAALRVVERCTAMLDDLGASPSEATAAAFRRAGSG